MKCQSLFYMKIKKNISKCRLLKFLPSMLSVHNKVMIKCATPWENVPFVACVNSEDADHPALLRSLIRSFIVRFQSH